MLLRGHKMFCKKIWKISPEIFPYPLVLVVFMEIIRS